MNTTISIDRELKNSASQVAEEFGLNLTSVIRSYLRQIVRNRKIFYQYEEPNEETIDAMREGNSIIASGKKRYKNSTEFFNSLGI